MDDVFILGVKLCNQTIMNPLTFKIRSFGKEQKDKLFRIASVNVRAEQFPPIAQQQYHPNLLS